MEAKIILRKGPLRKILHLTGRKVVDSTYFPRPIIAEKAYHKLREIYEEDHRWVVEVKEKRKLIIVPGESNEMIQKGYKSGI